jgi:hypothetical protein
VKNSGTPTARTWRAMMARCYDMNDHAYAKYGELGITVDPKWKTLDGFISEMGDRPSGTSLDRIDNSKGYYKENCRWATRTTQNRNRSTARFITLDGQTKQLAEWAELLGVNRRLIQCRVAKGFNSIADMKPRYKRAGIRSSSKGVYVTVDGVTLKLTEWAKKTGIGRTTIAQRVKYGWSIEDAVSTPKNTRLRVQ